MWTTKQCGENHPGHKLTEKDVLEMRELYESGGYHYKDLAEKYDVSIRTVFGVMSGEAWKCVTDGIEVSQEKRILGKLHGSRKLTVDQIREIYNAYWNDPNVKQIYLANKYGVSQSRISYIVNGKSWKWLKLQDGE